MTIGQLGLFKAMGAKMHYLNERQRVISDNIANSDTPGRGAYDLKPVDFATAMRKLVKPTSVPVERSNPLHISPNGDIDNPRNAKDRDVYEVAPSGNNIILEEQSIAARKTSMDYNLMLNLLRKNASMMTMALTGSSGSGA